MHHHTVPWEELADVVDDVAVDGVGVGPVGSLEVAEAGSLEAFSISHIIATLLFLEGQHHIQLLEGRTGQEVE